MKVLWSILELASLSLSLGLLRLFSDIRGPFLFLEILVNDWRRRRDGLHDRRTRFLELEAVVNQTPTVGHAATDADAAHERRA